MIKQHVRRPLRAASLLFAALLLTAAMLSVTVVPVHAATSVSDLQNQLSKLENEEKALKQKLSQYQNDLEKQKEYSDSLKRQIENTKSQIENLSSQVDLLNEKLNEKNSDITRKEQEIEQKQTELEDKFELLRERLRLISQTGNLSSLQMLLETESYVDFLLKENVVQRVAENDQRLMDEMERELERMGEEKQALETDRLDLESQKQQIEELKKKSDEKKKELDKLYTESNAVLKRLQSSVNNTQTSLKSSKEEQEKLEKQIQQLLAQSNSTGKYGGGTMFWPVPTVRNISSTFGSRWGTIHRGIDIANGSIPIYGQNVVAAADGTVIYANTSGWGGGYGLFVIVDHGLDSNGRQISTLYAHNSKVLVRVGDQVVGGKTVLSQAGASGDVTGPHLHFEVRVNGIAVDPIGNGYVKANG